jgi:hypothetical protein
MLLFFLIESDGSSRAHRSAAPKSIVIAALSRAPSRSACAAAVGDVKLLFSGYD